MPAVSTGINFRRCRVVAVRVQEGSHAGAFFLPKKTTPSHGSNRVVPKLQFWNNFLVKPHFPQGNAGLVLELMEFRNKSNALDEPAPATKRRRGSRRTRTRLRGHLEQRDMTDAGGLRTRRRAAGRETILQQSKIDSRGGSARSLTNPPDSSRIEASQNAGGFMVATGLMNDIAYGQLSMRKTKTAALGQALFLVLAMAIPWVFHLRGIVFPAILVFQPMHWMILFAGLAYGPLSGAMLGAAVPLASFMLSGHPLPAMLPTMVPELAAYGLVAGLLKGKVTAFGAVAIAMVAGRLVFLAVAAPLGGIMVRGEPASVIEFARFIWAPGLASMLLQIAVIPVLAGLYVNWAKDKEEK